MQKVKLQKIINIVVVLILVSVAFPFIFIMHAEVYTLVADADLRIRRVVNQSDKESNLVGILRAGDSAVVLACEDYKSDIALLVRLPTGDIGYLSEGSFRLKKEDLINYLPWGSNRLVWSCRNMFDSRKFKDGSRY